MIGSVIFIALLAYAIAMLFVKSFSVVFYYIALVFKFGCTIIGFLVFGLIMFLFHILP